MKTSKSVVEKLKLIGASLSKKRRNQMRQIMLTKAIPAAAEWHKTNDGHEWHKKQYKKISHFLHVKHRMNCDQCGKEFLAEKGRFCSNSCKSKWWRNQKLDDMTRKCVICGSHFRTNKYHKTTTCSKSCASKLLWINHHKK